jgi:hypothetical protein
MKPSNKPAAVLAAALLIAAGVPGALFAAEVYKWTDEDGVVHFSDQEPVGRDAQVENLREDPPAPESDPYPEAEAGSSAAQQRREEIERKGREAREQTAMTEQNCSAWEAELERLEPNRRVFFTNEEGETERMDDVARTDRVAELESLIDRDCR